MIYIYIYKDMLISVFLEGIVIEMLAGRFASELRHLRRPGHLSRARAMVNAFNQGIFQPVYSIIVYVFYLYIYIYTIIYI